jgi:hypothetical protein
MRSEEGGILKAAKMAEGRRYQEVTAGAMLGYPRYRVPVATPPISFGSAEVLRTTVRRALSGSSTEQSAREL